MNDKMKKDMIVLFKKILKELEEEANEYKLLYVNRVRCNVWCRNARVSKEAVICESVYCEYKEGKFDIIEGTKLCMQYITTLPGFDFSNAPQLEGVLREE